MKSIIIWTNLIVLSTTKLNLRCYNYYFVFILFKQLKKRKHKQKRNEKSLYIKNTSVRIIIITSKRSLKLFLKTKFKCKILNISKKY